MRHFISLVAILVALLSLSACDKSSFDGAQEIATPRIKKKVVNDAKPPATDIEWQITAKDDGKLIIYNKAQHLYAYYPDASNHVNLGIKGNNPVLSGDGSTLVYERGKNLHIRDLRTNNDEVMGEGSEASLSYNGKRIAYERKDTIYVFKRANGKNITKRIGTGRSPSIANNGKSVVYYNLVPGNRNSQDTMLVELLYMSLDDSKARKTIARSKFVYSGFEIDYSGDDRFIVFQDNDMFLLELESGKKEKLPLDILVTARVKVARDGTKIAWIQGTWSGEEESAAHLFDIKAGIETRFIVPGELIGGDIFISSDERRIVFTRLNPQSASEKASLWVVDID